MLGWAASFPEEKFHQRRRISSCGGKYPPAQENILFQNTLAFFERRF
jgi:hypothetical protein